MSSIYQKFIEHSRKINWILLLFMILLLNVKLPVKLVAFIVIALSQYRRISIKEVLSQKHLYFYFTMAGIGILNYLLRINNAGINSFLSTAFGILLWVICAAASYYLFRIAQNEEKDKLHNTVALFFMLHIGVVFLNLLQIMIETGSINPYTYKGLNQKYFISTGDFISGITFDSPVTTAIMSAMGLLYFLYRRYYILSLASMASLLIIASNLTNIMLAAVLIFIFICYTDKLQKSLIIVHLSLLLLFTSKISPQNNEYLGRFAYKILGMTYDLPKKNESPEFLKSSPDSLLNSKEKNKKIALLYLDSVNTLRIPTDKPAFPASMTPDVTPTEKPALSKDSLEINNSFYKYKEAQHVIEKKNKYLDFIKANYSESERDSLDKLYDWNKPGKWIAAKQLMRFFNDHPGRLLLGAGTGNFSSRTAFKTTSLGIAGGYPAQFRYIHPWFLHNHLYLYTYYHSQGQTKHAAENTPDSTYGQLLGEYGILGLLSFLSFYLGYFIRHFRRLSFGLSILLLLLAAFFVEYWFEQLSIVILAELLLFLDIRHGKHEVPEQREKQPL